MKLVCMYNVNFRLSADVHVVQTGNVLKALFGHPTQRRGEIPESGACRRYSYGPRKKTIKFTFNVVCASLDTVDPGYLQFEWL